MLPKRNRDSNSHTYRDCEHGILPSMLPDAEPICFYFSCRADAADTDDDFNRTDNHSYSVRNLYGTDADCDTERHLNRADTDPNANPNPHTDRDAHPG